MPYTAEKPWQPPSSDELRARIPGWGADLDPADRPSVPRESEDRRPPGATWHFPDRQPEPWPRERSIEHAQLTPVFGTSCPPKGLSGAIRKLSYRRYSEGRAAHWLLLLLADRVDVAEHRVTGLLRGRPDRMLHETGVRSELGGHPIRSRFGRGRTDIKHQPLDPFVVAAPWVAGGVLAYRLLRRRRRS